MLSMKKHIPNLITLGNLFCGTIATIFAVQSEFKSAALFVVLGIVLDFFDGFAARLLKVSGELGKQLDSLADMVTSGVVPGIIMYHLLNSSEIIEMKSSTNNEAIWELISVDTGFIKFLGLLLTLGACYRLAKFNIDTRQSDSFIGLPTPAMSLFIISLPLIQEYTTFEFIQHLISNYYFLIVITLLLTYLMNAELPLFSLKFKNYNFKNNVMKYFFLITSLVLLLTLKYTAVPVIILFYVVLSLISNYRKKTTV
ncbi:MAG: CDP-diacylglycerol--glycerol-3-phosphate 3-phosphatidyltransferase [Polaribacter sp. SA4-10]|nr:MAG: CDP-diacylglycerol--glycerol-3-phosphate 3-phosphatidyltransferase [Polaribacter sp. SA4-10]